MHSASNCSPRHSAPCNARSLKACRSWVLNSAITLVATSVMAWIRPSRRPEPELWGRLQQSRHRTKGRKPMVRCHRRALPRPRRTALGLKIPTWWACRSQPVRRRARYTQIIGRVCTDWRSCVATRGICTIRRPASRAVYNGDWASQPDSAIVAINNRLEPLSAMAPCPS